MVLAAFCTPAIGQNASRDWMAEGHQLYARENYAEAIKAYDRAIDKPGGGNATSAYLKLFDAFVEGSARNRSYIITVTEFIDRNKNNTDWIIVDVREPPEYLKAHIKGAINIPYTKLATSMKIIPEGKRVAVYCATNRRAQYAVMALRIFEGRDAWILLDGVSAWKESGQPLDLGPALNPIPVK
jgi:rhodanese-related sulfurtransferase